MSAATLYADLIDRGLSFRVDDEADRLIVSSGDLLSDADRAAIRLHKAELMAMASIDPGASGQADEPAAVVPLHPTPSRCLAPVACAVLGVCGVCGREACVPADEFGRFAAAMATARRSDYAHGVPDFYPEKEAA